MAKETVDAGNDTVYLEKDAEDHIKEMLEEIMEMVDPVKYAVNPAKGTVEETKETIDLQTHRRNKGNKQTFDENVMVWERNLKICFVFLLSVYEGVVENSFGPTVADFQCIYKETQQRSSLLYPIFITLKALGTVAFLLFRNRMDPYTMGVVCTVVDCVLLVSLPLLPALWLALSLTGLNGFTAGIAGHARLIESGQLGKTSAVPLHLFPLGLCTGSFIAPLIISPFLGVRDTYGRNQTFDNSSVSTNTKLKNSYVNVVLGEIEDNNCENFSSGILYAFLIFLGGAIALVMIYVFFRKTLKSDIKRSDSNYSDTKSRVILSDMVFLTLLGILVISAPSNFIFANFLSTFGIHSQLKLTPHVMALMTSSFFGATVIGRIVGILISLVLKQITLQVVCLLCSVGAAIALVFVEEVSTASLWAMTSTLAFVYAPLFGAIIAWSTEICKAKHILYGLIIIADLVGCSLLAFLFGQLMSNVHNDWLIYCMLGMCVLQVVVLFIMYVVSKFMAEENETLYEVNGKQE